MSAKSVHLRKITLSALLLAIALILKTFFSFYIPLFGENGMRVGVSGVFSAMPSILFGPLYGSAVTGLSDLLGHFLKPAGPYMPLFTLTACLAGGLRGILWMAFRRRGRKAIRIAMIVVIAVCTLFGLTNLFMLRADGVDASFYDQGVPEPDGLHWITRMLVERTQNTSDPGGNLVTYSAYMTTYVLGFAALALVLMLVDVIVSKRLFPNEQGGGALGILLAMLISGLIVTTINTVILREMVFASWKVMPFVIVWLPRVVEEVVTNTVNAYIIAFLYGLVKRNGYLKQYGL